MRTFCAITMLAAAAGSTPSFADGPAVRTFVSSAGTDHGLCSRTTPCRTFGYALTKTAAAGELIALDTGEYGPLLIDKSIKVASAPGALASIDGGVTGYGIEIKAGSDDRVELNALSLFNGGINIAGASSVEVSDISVRSSPSYGLIVNSPSKVIVDNSVFSNSNNEGVKQEAKDSNVILRRVTVTGGPRGAGIQTRGLSTILDSTVSNNGAGGIAVYETAFAVIKGTVIAANRDGLQVLGKATVSTTIVTSNGTGVFNSGKLDSYKDNYFFGNTARDIYGPAPITTRPAD